ncbi:MAG: DUF2157 domain-containing protein [Cyanobacteria bacterium P01_A01_bin.45]
MSLKSEPPIHIGVKLPGNHPQLLTGLDTWLQLGLISDGQVRQICQEYLSCRLVQIPKYIEENKPHKLQSKLVSVDSFTDSKKNRKTSVAPSFVSSVLQSLLAELSVRWLLFLGMFLVVLSSGVLAASQWERFPASGQYSILWGYSLTFWIVSFWAGKQKNLKLTAGTLLVVTLLLIPVNFWAIDSFKLWHHPFDWGVVAFASISLTFITNSLCNNSLFIKFFPIGKLYFLNLIGLSYLHWGWRIPGVPILVVYIATIGTAAATVLQITQKQNIQKQTAQKPTAQKSTTHQQQLIRKSEGKIVSNANKSVNENINEPVSQREANITNINDININTNSKNNLDIGLPAAVIVYSLVVLLVRAIFVVSVDITQLGLAVGICGWLIAWLGLNSQGIQKEDQQETKKPETNQQKNKIPKKTKTGESVPSLTLPWQFIGGILICFGWFISFDNHPVQAFAVSGLAVWFFHTRLQKYSLRADLAAIFFTGLQSLWLGWRLVPVDLRSLIVKVAADITNTQPDYWLLLSLAIFPYIIAIAVFSDRLHLEGRTKLAQFSELLNFSLGLLLTFISLLNPTLRSLNLLLSTTTLIIVSSRYTFSYDKRLCKLPRILPYLTHIATILAICSWVDLFLPKLASHHWAVILLVLMVAEWLFSVGNGVWRRSGWYIGFGLALLSFTLLYNYLHRPIGYESWGLTWLVTPITLTAISTRGENLFRKVNLQSSVTALCIAQLLTFPVQGIRLIGLGIATILMYVNTGYLKVKLNAVITVGFSIAFLATFLWDNILGISFENWLLINSVTILSLWGLHKALLRWNRTGDNQPQNHQLLHLYTSAINYWAIFLCGLEIFLLSCFTALSYTSFNYTGLSSTGLTFVPSSLTSLISASITLLAIFINSWNSPSNWNFYGIAWCLELIVAQGLTFGKTSFVRIAIANILLGLIVQLFGEWWKRKHSLNHLPPRWNILPLAYGLFGIILRFGTFENWTGLSSLLVSLIIIGIGRRDRKLKPLLYLGLFGVSISVYELLLYQISQASGDTFGDAFIIMAALGASIMSTYRILSPWLRSSLGLSSLEIKTISHIHWGWSSALLIGAIPTPVAQNPLAFGIGLVLVRYAIFQGKVSINLNSVNSNSVNSNFVNSDSESTQPDPIKKLKNPKTKNFKLEDLKINEIWIYIGLIEAYLISNYFLKTPIGQLFTDILPPLQAGIICVISYFLYILPWQKWSWSKQPWQNTSYVLPLVFIYLTRLEIYPITLLIVAVFYVFLAVIAKKFRTTYISLLLLNWALWKLLINLQFTDTQWYATSIGLSLLYIAQFDSHLKLPEQKETRHLIRLLGTGIICIWATLFHQDNPLIPGTLNIIAIFAGLGLRIRAFLYIGTAGFLATSFYQLVLYIGRYPFIKWIVGLIIGIIFIAIAANFENRRTQVNSLLRNTNNQLSRWE